jgi:REP element-mobilizing transposase RayT
LEEKLYNPKIHHRKSIRLKEYDYANANWYYVTICTQGKEHLFGKVINNKVVLNSFGKIVQEEWLRTKEIRKNVDLDYYIIMPNHIHGIIIIEYNANELNINGGRDTMHRNNFNVGATRRVAQNNTPNNNIGASHRLAPTIQPNSLGSIIGQFKSICTKRIKSISDYPHQSIWQRNYFEHIIRNDEDLYRIRKYIRQNPLKWQLDECY